MDLESRLIKLGASRKDLRPHIRPILALIRLASSTLYAVVDQKVGGGIIGASDNVHAKKERFWRGRLPADWKKAYTATTRKMAVTPIGATPMIWEGCLICSNK